MDGADSNPDDTVDDSIKCFKTAMSSGNLEFTLSTVWFNNHVFDSRSVKKSDMAGEITLSWKTGVNVFDKETEYDEGNGDYSITYLLSFGDTKTRNGELQLLSGKLILSYNAGTYKLEVGTLKHSSYTLDLSKCTITDDGTKIKIITN